MSKWIDINKQHPVWYKEHQVLVYMPKAYITIDVQHVYNDGMGGSCFQDGWRKGQQFEITHWMRLPKPPIETINRNN